jgi:hypothetical protein
MSLLTTTGWINPAGLQGRIRTKRFWILGNYRGPHRLVVKIAYDYNDVFTETVIIDTSSAVTVTRYGEDSPYGSGSPYGGEFQLEQFEVSCESQPHQAIKVSVYDVPPADQAFSTYSLTGLTLQWMPRGGVQNLPATKRFGATR